MKIKRRRKVDMTTGNISEKLVQFAVPLMLISFMQMAYNMTDIMWLGHLAKTGKAGVDAVTSAGTAGFYMWLSGALLLMPKIGAEVKVSMYTGANNEEKAREYARSAIQLAILLGVIYAVVVFVFRSPLIRLLRIENETINREAIKYLGLVVFGVPFSFYNQNMSGVYYGVGRSGVPLKFSTVGLTLNIILDPILIFGMFGLPKLGIMGAAIATVISQFVISVLYSVHIKSINSPFSEFHLFRKPVVKDMLQLIKVGYPVGLMSGMFTFFAMVIAGMLNKYGDTPIAVQKVGSQIESISWMTAGGFQSAVRSFVGQNYGARQFDRIKKGFIAALKIITAFGFVVTLVMYVFAGPIFKLFLPSPLSLQYGIDYLRILALSQYLMMVEMVASGAFNGLSITKYPSIIGAVFTGLRIPAAMYLSMESVLGLNGFWWAITMSSNIKGLILLVSFFAYLKYSPRLKREMNLELV